MELLSPVCWVSLVLGNEANSEAGGSTSTINYIATKTIAKDSKTIKQIQAKGFRGFLQSKQSSLAALPPAEKVLCRLE